MLQVLQVATPCYTPLQVRVRRGFESVTGRYRLLQVKQVGEGLLGGGLCCIVEWEEGLDKFIYHKV
jgi:hypothetical protein